MFYSMVIKYKNSWAAIIKMLATSKSCGNICCFFYQHCQPGKITLQVSVLTVGYLVAESFELWMG